MVRLLCSAVQCDEGLLNPTSAVVEAVNALNKDTINGMVATLAEEIRVHQRNWIQIKIKWHSLAGGGNMRREGMRIIEPLCAATNKSVKTAVSTHLWVRHAHLKGMAIHAREKIYVLDVGTNGTASAQAYAYTSIQLSNDDSFDSGTAHPMQSRGALQFLPELIGGGILSPVFVLRWQDTGNLFQAVTYDKERLITTADS
ncbi:hypothetical protein GQ600_18530 [Phytophthora cactorum]|nr:hypothetical protein GQ600_18530 [Phytophthora cactorum]